MEEAMPLVAKRADPRSEEEEIEISVEVVPASSPVIDVVESTIPLSELPASAIPAAPSQPSPEAAKAAVAQAPVAAPATPAAPPQPEEPILLQRQSTPPPKPSSVPPSGGARRRAPGEDLIGDLFERMHELAFMADMVSGAQFVLHVLGELIPCEGILIHVFDLGKREFVVVRAQGPNARDALLHRTADAEPLVRGIMSKRGATILDGAPANPPPASSSLTKLGVNPRAVLCGAARLGGRYLGLIELANPAGDQPFHAGEANALDYVCEQFAEFIASRPIVLDADVVVGS